MDKRELGEFGDTKNIGVDEVDIAHNFREVLNNIPDLKNILEILKTNNIKYGLYAGAFVSILTSYRVPTDVDFLVADTDYLKLTKLFDKSEPKKWSYGDFLSPDQKNKVDFMANATASPDGSGSRYLFRMTDLAWSKTSVINIDGLEVRFCDPVDTILLKAMLQRGGEESKSDIADIEALLKVVSIDKKYLAERLKETGSDERMLLVLRKFGLV